MERVYRHIIPRILEAQRVSPVTFLNGARQAGKSTLVQDIAADPHGAYSQADYISFDSPTQMAAAAASPHAFLSARKKPLIIDEVQMVPELFRTLKTVVDDLRRTDSERANGRYLLTGSSNILALPKLADPLVGRMVILTLYPFSAAEVSGGKGDALSRLFAMDFTNMNDRKLSLVDAIKSATFPEVSDMDGTGRRIWFNGYITTMLQRDVRMLADLEKIAVLPNLLRVLCTRAGGLINDSDIAREVGLTSVTGKSYRNILKMMFLNFDLQPWHSNIGKRLVKASKGYLTDTMLLCHMLDLNIEDIAKAKPGLFGHVVENFIATELIKLLSFTDIRAQLLHFRTADGKEVDFILERADSRLIAIEIKKSESVNMNDFNGIQTFATLAGKNFIGGVVMYSGQEVVPFGENLWAVPFHLLWQ